MNKLQKWGLGTLMIGSLSFFAFTKAENYFELSKNLEIYASLYKELNTYYVDDIEPAQLMRNGIDAMTKSLDPYTNFISESEIEDYRFMTTGQYGGVGAQILQRDGKTFIREIYESWPAYKAELRAGDEIVEIDGKALKGKSSDDVSKLLKGQPGTEVKLLIHRDGMVSNELKSVIREEIKVKSVPFAGIVEKDYGYIKFIGFRQDAAKEVQEAFLELKKNNPNMKGLILDLRGNPGGLLDEAIKSVNIFVDNGQMIVFTKGKMEDWNKEYFTTSPATDNSMKVVALIDGNSASASEIVSGSLQDLDRAVVIGENSFGKGLVQTTRPLPYGTQVKVTTSKYYIPSGRCIQEIDYSKRDSEGRPIKNPDSVKTAFKTKSGRPVYSGHGIKPDIAIDRDSSIEILNTLLEKYVIFDFATKYRNEHPKIAKAEEFKISNKDWEEFLSFAKNKDIQYNTATEEALKNLELIAKSEKYYGAIKSDYEMMLQKLKVDKKEDIIKHKSLILHYVEDEIASRYYFQKGRIESRFDDDKDIKEGVKVLSNPVRYKEILTATK